MANPNALGNPQALAEYRAKHPAIPGARALDGGFNHKDKRKTLKSLFTMVLQSRCPEDLTMLGLDPTVLEVGERRHYTYEEIIILQIATKAVRGDLEAAKLIHDRMEGKPLQTSQNLNVEMSYSEFLDKLDEVGKAEHDELFS